MTTFRFMRAIGIRELKAQLNRILREVQRGEVVLVTDRGQVVAELRRPDWSTLPMSGPERALAQLAAEGTLRLRQTVAEPYPVSPLSLPEGSALELLAEDCDEE